MSAASEALGLSEVSQGKRDTEKGGQVGLWGVKPLGFRETVINILGRWRGLFCGVEEGQV